MKDIFIDIYIYHYFKQKLIQLLNVYVFKILKIKFMIVFIQAHSDALLSAIELLYNLDQTNANVYLSQTANLFPLSK